VTWNHGAERLYGYTATEMRGRSIALLIPDDRTAELEEILGEVRAGRRVESHETIRRTKDGRLIDVALTVSPVTDRDGHVLGAATLGRDITDQKRAQVALKTSEQRTRASESRWQSIVDSAVDAIIVIDSAGLIDAFNPAAERLFGYHEAEVVGRNVKILMPSPYREEHDSYLARYLATGAARIIGKGREVIAQRRDGTTFPVHLSVGEMHSTGERMFTGIIHDLSARVAIETQLREQAAMARLGEMAAVIAHEVKNPLAGIRGAIQVIGSRLPAGSREAAVTHDIIARIDGLNALMKDLLLFARPPQPTKRPVDVGQLIVTTASLLSQDPEAASVRVEVAGSAEPLMADPELLKIVFVNLLVNATHAMEGTGTIQVSLAVENGRCRLVFADSGPGIPTEVRQQIFTPFFTTKARGSGLGLPTAKRLIEAHGGTITIECPEAGGTEVSIELPV